MLFRKPYELKKLIIVHNIVQVVSCIFVVYEVGPHWRSFIVVIYDYLLYIRYYRQILHITEYTILYFWRCSVVEETPERMARHFRLAYFLFWLKLSELIETVIFVMRQKQNQVTKLHVFHHISTVTLIYMLINHNRKNGAYQIIDATRRRFLLTVILHWLHSCRLRCAVPHSAQFQCPYHYVHLLSGRRCGG